MAELYYVGLKPSVPSDTENLVNVKNQLGSGVSRSYVTSRAADIVAGRVSGGTSGYATRDYVDVQDSQFTTADYYQAQDALLTPNNAKGNPNGVASLVNGKIPLTQIPVLGVGILKGPRPPSHVYDATTFDVPAKIADWQLGVAGMACQPWAFMGVSLLSNGGLPVIEIKVGNPTQTTYASQTLVSLGYGRSYYYDYQTVEVIPTDPDLNEGQDGAVDFYPSTFDMVLTAWVYDGMPAGSHQQVTVTGNLITSASVYLARMNL